MTFALAPNGGPPRLLRFRDLEPGLLSVLDVPNNVLVVDRDAFEKLDPVDQHITIRTWHPRLYVTADHNGVMTVSTTMPVT